MRTARQYSRDLLFLPAVAAAPLAGSPISVLGRTGTAPPSADPGHCTRLASGRVPFVEKQGQLDARVAFSAPTLSRGSRDTRREARLFVAIGARK